MQRYTVYFTWKLLYIFRVVPPPIIRSADNCICSIWYLSHRYCYLPLSWKSWNVYLQHLVFVTPLLLPAAIVEELEGVSAASGICHTVTATCRYRGRDGSSSTIAAGSSNGVTNARCCSTVVCAPDDGWRNHPKHVEQFSNINKMCNVASCWIYIGIHMT